MRHPPVEAVVGGRRQLLQELHCSGCGHYLLSYYLEVGVVQVTCRWCGVPNTLDIQAGPRYSRPRRQAT